VNWAVDGGAYRIDEIVRGAPWDVETRSPLDRSGVDVEEGDYVLAVNGRTIDPAQDPWAAFQGLAGKTVELTVNDEPSREGAERVVVEMMSTGEEERLRYLSWINQNRLRVEEATDGRVGYVYVPNTGISGQTDLLRQWRAQVHKDALIIDERFNSGGQIPDRFVELLNRPPKAYWAVRHGEGFQTPSVMHDGPKTMLINGWSGSGGDAFPDYFRKADLGPLIGSRTWGGLIGISGAPSLVDGGVATVPTFRMYNPDGTWFAEGTGVRPDIPVVNNPATLYDGTDQVLERAIDEMEAALEENNPSRPAPPAYEDRTAAPDETGSDDG
jgi:tricorn protease